MLVNLTDDRQRRFMEVKKQTVNEMRRGVMSDERRRKILSRLGVALMAPGKIPNHYLKGDMTRLFTVDLFSEGRERAHAKALHWLVRYHYDTDRSLFKRFRLSKNWTLKPNQDLVNQCMDFPVSDVKHELTHEQVEYLEGKNVLIRVGA